MNTLVHSSPVFHDSGTYGSGSVPVVQKIHKKWQCLTVYIKSDQFTVRLKSYKVTVCGPHFGQLK